MPALSLEQHKSPVKTKTKIMNEHRDVPIYRTLLCKAILLPLSKAR